MVKVMKIVDNVYYVGVNDRNKTLFENQWPLPCGVSYNSYLLVDDKVALVDTVDISCCEVFFNEIEEVLAGRKIDYLIINHMEPDHSGSIGLVRQKYPDIKIVGNAKTFSMIKGYFGIEDGLLEVKDGDSLSLGSLKLSFFLTPMVHWPETMMTYDTTHQILFSGDAFGCFGALDGGVLDSTINPDRYWDEMRRYYACIVGKYGSPVQKALSKLKDVKLEYICSTHGPVWQKETAKAVALYDRWSRYVAEPGAVVVYGSMYGNTEQMAESVARGLVQGGVKNVVVYNATKTDPSFILSDVFRYSALVVGSPTYMNELFPVVESFLQKVARRDVKNRIFASFGSASWAGVSVKRISEIIDKCGWRLVGSVDNLHAATSQKKAECELLGKQIALEIQKEG
ncbi:MAG: FprA family A-type flavoprotein [Paludibacteraceae bacterium]|nr:FprA family A-type flavoprotein [Prevotellaceae bacterium]